MTNRSKFDFYLFTLGLLAFAFLYLPVFAPPFSFGVIDHDYHNSWQLIVNDALRHGKILHWNPYLCGGSPGLGNPQSSVLSPFNFFGLFLSPVIQFKLELLINSLLGLVGFGLYGKAQKLSKLSVLLGYIIWSGCGVVAGRILNGQTAYLTLHLIPLVIGILAIQRADTRRTFSFLRMTGLAATLLLILLQDGFHTLIYLSPLLGCLLFGWTITDRRVDLVILAGISGMIAALLALPRLLPAFDFLSATPRLVDQLETVSLSELIRQLIDSDLLGFVNREFIASGDGHRLGYLGFVGVVPLVLSALFLLRSNERSRWWWFIGGGFGFVFALGAFAPYAPWTILRSLPVFHMVRAPFKFLAAFSLALSFLSMHSLSSIFRAPNTWGDRLSRLVVGVCLANYALALLPLFAALQKPYAQAAETIERSRPFELSDNDAQSAYRSVAQNQAVVECYEPVLRQNAVNPGDPIVAINPPGQINSSTVGINQISVSYSSQRPTTLKLYQNFDPLWIAKADQALPIQNVSGLMVVDVPAGNHSVTFTYYPKIFYRGLLLSGFGLCVLVLIVCIRFKRHR